MTTKWNSDQIGAAKIHSPAERSPRGAWHRASSPGTTLISCNPTFLKSEMLILVNTYQIKMKIFYPTRGVSVNTSLRCALDCQNKIAFLNLQFYFEKSELRSVSDQFLNTCEMSQGDSWRTGHHVRIQNMDGPFQDHEDLNPDSQKPTGLQSESSDPHQKQMEELGGDGDPCQASAQEVDRQDPHGALDQGEENTPEWDKSENLSS